MGLARLLLGLILAALGFLVVFASWAVNAGPSTAQVAPGEAIGLTPQALTSERLSLGWYATTGTTHVYVTTAAPECPMPQSTVATGNGSSGHLNATLQPGVTYYLFGCDATSFKEINVAYTVNGGVTAPEILGVLSLGLGGVLLLWGARRSRRPEEVERPATQVASTEGEEVVLPSAPVVRKPRRIAAVLSRSIEASRGMLIRRAKPSAELRGHVMQPCRACGRVYPPGRYTTCPGCGDVFEKTVPTTI